MKCAWKELLSVLPSWLGAEIRREADKPLMEIRLRVHQPVQLVYPRERRWLERLVTGDDIQFCVNAASYYSPWAAESMARGYLTAAGGHRIGICGDTIEGREGVAGMRNVTSLCIRVARDFPGIASDCVHLTGSVLIIGPPGSGKTTFARDLARLLSRKEAVAVVDQRCELFPSGTFSVEGALDVMSGCPKEQGIHMVLRSMGPETIVVDEITEAEDARALLHAGWCGVRLIATAHAAGLSDLRDRPLYKPLMESGLFDYVIVLKNQTLMKVERISR